MPTIDQFKQALIKAHRAGDTRAAQLFASKIKQINAQEQPDPVQQQAQPSVQSDIDVPQASPILDAPQSPEAQAQMQNIQNQKQAQSLGNKAIEKIYSTPIVGGVVKGATDIGRGAMQLGAIGADVLAGLGGKDLGAGRYMDQQIQANEAQYKRNNPNSQYAINPFEFLGSMAGGGIAGGGIKAFSKNVALASGTSPVVQRQGEEGDLAEFSKQKAIQTGAAIATGGLLKGGQKILTKRPQIMSADEIRKQASQAYKLADEKGGILSPDATNSFIEKIQGLKPQTEIGKIVGGDSPFTNLVDKVSEIKDKPMSLGEAQELDELLGEAMDSFVDAGRLTKQGKKIFDIQTALRETIEEAPEGSVVGTKEGFEALKEGRKLWSRSRKLADVERIIQRASNMEQPATSIKAGFRTLLHNPKRMRGFTKAERVAIKKASESGVVQDVVRTFGSRLIPIVTGASGAGLGGTAAATVGSTASRGIGARIQMDKAQEVAELVASGGKARAKPSLTPQQTQRQATASLVAARSMPDLENNVEQPKAISAPKKSALFEKIRAQRAKAKSTPSNDENINILSGFLPKQSARRLAKLNSKSPNIKASKIFKEAAKENPEIFFKEDGRSRTISEVYNALTAGDF